MSIKFNYSDVSLIGYCIMVRKICNIVVTVKAVKESVPHIVNFIFYFLTSCSFYFGHAPALAKRRREAKNDEHPGWELYHEW